MRPDDLPAPRTCGKPGEPDRKEAGRGAGGQSRRMSAVEATVSVAVGYVVSVAATILILPAFGLPVSHGQAYGISAAFTGISLIRSYLLRRAFNALERRRVRA